MAWTFLPSSAHFFRFKNWCKITSRKKSSLTSALVLASLGVKLSFLSKKCIFRAEKVIFSKSSFYTKIISDPEYNFSLGQKYLVVASFKVSIFHQIQPIHTYFQNDARRPHCHWDKKSSSQEEIEIWDLEAEYWRRNPESRAGMHFKSTWYESYAVCNYVLYVPTFNI